MGIVQEQHADRARLYRQWRQLEWPILVDSLNLLDFRVVPIPMAIDESGAVWSSRLRRPSELDAFLAQPAAEGDWAAEVPEPYRIDAPAAHFLAGRLGDSIQAYRAALEEAPDDSRARFRLGVTLRARHESEERVRDDAQNAVSAWHAALSSRPDQYIWRRRLQQFGPRLAKPYNFYAWVEEARAEIRARGEEPVELAWEPRGTEIAAPLEAGDGVELFAEAGGDRIPYDDQGLVELNAYVTPDRIAPGDHVQLRVVLTLSRKSRPWWNNESVGCHLWVDADSLELVDGAPSWPQPAEAETQERRILELEIDVTGRESGKVTIPGRVTYDVCEDEEGVCRRLRQDFEVEVVIDPEATSIK